MLKRSDDYFATLYAQADKAGRAAAEACRPTAMIVGQSKGLFSNKIDYSKPVDYVADGVCGFAWVNIKPGNSAFANWLKKEKIALRDGYYGGVSIWVSGYNQSMERKMAYAGAFARTLEAAGLKRVYAMSRMD